MKENETPQAFSRCGYRVKNCSVLKSPLPGISRLVQVFGRVESEMQFLERNTLRVAELKHVTERDDR
jgi:hypothetical protein